MTSPLDDWRAAIQCLDACRAGHWPQPVGVSAGATEPIFVQAPAALDRQNHITLAYGAHAGKHAAAAPWAFFAQGTAMLTPARVILHPHTSLGWQNLASLWGDETGVYFAYADTGQGPTSFRLRVAYPLWWITMIHAVGFRQLYPLHPPRWVLQQLNLGG